MTQTIKTLAQILAHYLKHFQQTKKPSHQSFQPPLPPQPWSPRAPPCLLASQPPAFHASDTCNQIKYNNREHAEEINSKKTKKNRNRELLNLAIKAESLSL
ncbi:hypothetical protein ES288_A12G182200v1 [Gossypium darwinii]|uniref:Uncharacterized protein n=1 Tax=Gossypium darwinii TaxID=34276 RepID=A0A5D2EAS7_GOSDA|nr:hypothetical protein ES288_A12G182200v1 [Gossypium darwinii]